ncbi:unnamed protein product [Larinioides sclopetarius]|uniref:GTP-binding protein n=1 Tax=Larinioides sclopetarius TaxID=280406 RepID=A0AAV2BUA4_9ARAC
MAAQPNILLVGRRSRNWNLGEEIKSRLPPIHFSAPLGIIGARETGRKTLASRFSAMDADVLPRENAKTFFNSFHVRMARPYDSHRPVTLHLKAFICPPPESAGISIFQVDEQDHFCCFVFLFDVARRETFSTAKRFMNQHSNVKTKFLVGNKCDLRLSVPQNRTVSREEINEEALRWRIPYYECSARTKENVQSLLEAIQGCALQEKYKMSL